MTAKLVLEYLLWVFLANMGVYQIAFARAGLWGACFFRQRWAAYLFGAGFILGSTIWFFIQENRARPGLEGAQTFGFFVLGGLVALAFTLLTSSLINSRRMGSAQPGPGLEALRESTYWQAMKVGLWGRKTR